jgi:4-diphosphocytidyl-2-C-methyl-D-erythritol kinase
MIPVNWGDELRLSLRESSAFHLEMQVQNLKLEDDDNLCLRAARSFALEFKKVFELKMTLIKKIPTGAGLGGGSSDAAQVLRALADFYKLSHSNPRLLRVAKSLGADVPFALGGRPAWCTGIGEKLKPLQWLHGRWGFVIVVSRSHPVPTPWAYRELDRARPNFGPRDGLSGLPDWLLRPCEVPALENDFEAVVLKARRPLRAVQRSLCEAGAKAVRMSGSGSAFFGVFEDLQAAQKAAQRLNRRGFEAVATSVFTGART